MASITLLAIKSFGHTKAKLSWKPLIYIVGSLIYKLYLLSRLFLKMLFLLLAPLLDLCFNAANSLLHLDRDMQLMLVLLQDTLQVLGLLGIAVRFSSTFVFQVGLIGHLLRRFVATILAALLYLVLTILLHFFSLRDRWNSPSEPANPSYRYVWPTEVTVLFVLQRTVSILHYVLYKRTVLILADPKYHRESVWLLQKIGKQMND